MLTMEDNDALAILGLVMCLKKKKKRSLWCKDWLMKRKQFSHTNLLCELKFAPQDWHNYLRMNEEAYLNLLALVSPLIKKQDTVMREAISPHERLTATLRFLATGRSYQCMKFSTIISPQALSQIIPETCDALYEVLRKDYLKFPKREEEWRIIAREFEQKWNFPHCLGAIDGKHVEIVPPSNSGSFYYNYKHRHSMVLLAIVDAKYRFLLVDFGTNGRVSDGGVLLNTKFYEKLEKKALNIPTEERLHNSPRILPYVFVADDAFPLRKDMMKPFRQSDLDSRIKKIYNYRTSRARRIVENAFGILAARFRIYRTQMNMSPETIGSVVRATCALHNYLMSSSLNSYAPSECFDSEHYEEGTITSGFTTNDSTLEPLQRTTQGRTIQTKANQIRSQFMTYFVTEGKVPWQDNFVH